MIRSTLQDRYCRKAELGRTGMGVVYRASGEMAAQDPVEELLREAEAGFETMGAPLYAAQIKEQREALESWQADA